MSRLPKPGARAPRAPGGPAARRARSSGDRARRGAATGASSRGRCWVTRRYVRTRRVPPPAACASPKNPRSFPRAFRSRFRRARRAAADGRGAPPVVARVPQRARSRADRWSREPSRSALSRGGDPRVCSAERGRTAPPAPIVASLALENPVHDSSFSTRVAPNTAFFARRNARKKPIDRLSSF